ncbi:plasmid stabilization protein [Clostridium sp.]|uniref:plasmid stabilization protein n=1 Tax=Clostridium sp. TaxID=1506 RepID=UPI00284C5B65|nr:plasmid stabilization protein [Clostridium sp.]MDR3594830.1 plasmid stabilization protein [Clostridium sp.]
MENEILEILKSLQGSIIEIQKEQKMTNERLIGLEKGQTEANERLTKLEEVQQRIENKIDMTYDQVARTAEDITDIKKDLIFVEEATSKNWNDIAKLKAIK